MFGGSKKKQPLEFKGWPKVTPVYNRRKGMTGYRVKAHYLTPGVGQLKELIPVLVAFFFAVDFGTIVLHTQNWTLGIAVTACVLVLWAVSRPIWRRLLSRLAIVEIWPDVIRVAGFFRFHEFDRHIRHQFDLKEHEKAFDEKRKMETNREMPRSYTNSAWVVLRHPSGSLLIAAVYPMDEAERLLERLQAIEMAAEYSGMSAGKDLSGAMTPGSQRPDPA